MGIGSGYMFEGLRLGLEDKRRRRSEDAAERRATAAEERAGDLHGLRVNEYAQSSSERAQRMKHADAEEARRARQAELREEVRQSEQWRQESRKILAQLQQAHEAGVEVDPTEFARFYNERIPDGREGQIFRTPQGEFVLRLDGDPNQSTVIGQSVDDLLAAAYAATEPQSHMALWVEGRRLEQQRQHDREGLEIETDRAYQTTAARERAQTEALQDRREKGLDVAGGRRGGTISAGERTAYELERLGIITREQAAQVAAGSKSPQELAQGFYQDMQRARTDRSGQRQLAQMFGVAPEELTNELLWEKALEAAEATFPPNAGGRNDDPLGLISSESGSDPLGLGF